MSSDIFGEIIIPDVLNEREYQLCLSNYKNGDKSARDLLISHNIKLVIYIAKKYLNTCDGVVIELSDLVMNGIIGLICGIDTFDFDKNVKLNSYLSKCINNAILMYLRSNRKYNNIRSIEEIVFDDINDYKTLFIKDVIFDDSPSCLDMCIRNEEINFIRELVDKLDYINKEIVKLYFGFYNDREYTQLEISEIVGIKQPHISRRIKRIKRKLKESIID